MAGVDRFLHAAENPIRPQLLQNAEARQRLFGLDRFQPRQGEADIGLGAPGDQPGKNLRGGEIDADHGAGFQHDKARPVAPDRVQESGCEKHRR